MSNSNVNYIRHLDSFLDLVNSSENIHYGHVALYVSLFRTWNINYFKNPFTPSRSEIMSHAGLRSKDAYYRNLRDLEALSLIRYYPSKSRYEHSFFCISTLEHIGRGIKIDVWALTNHQNISNDLQTKISFGNDSNASDSKVVDINTKAKLFNGKGKLFLEKSIIMDHDGQKKELKSESSFDPLIDSRYASHLDQNISSLSNNSYHANHQNSKSGRSGLRPPGIQIDPNADYSVPL
ncbi:MAG: hypothetical protein IPL55_21610 [Saprospiraceae bacterium]|nr:hypothetical protein [Saprospiraceae bacterium]